MKLNANKLILAMANACITIGELADKSRVSRTAINKFTTGKGNPKPATIGKLAKALNVSVEDLIEKQEWREVIIIDHVLNAMKPHYEAVRDWFMEEQRTGQYKKYSENPYFEEIKALIDSMNILRQYMGWDKIRLKDEVEFYL